MNLKDENEKLKDLYANEAIRICTLAHFKS